MAYIFIYILHVYYLLLYAKFCLTLKTERKMERNLSSVNY